MAPFLPLHCRQLGIVIEQPVSALGRMWSRVAIVGALEQPFLRRSFSPQ